MEGSCFSQYVTVPDLQQRQQNKADLNKLIQNEFEWQKVIFGDEEEMQNPAEMYIPNSFTRFYKAEKLRATLTSEYNDVAELDSNELTIQPQKMKEFFEDAIEHICRYAFLALERVKGAGKKLEAVYLVGGFGGCNFIKKVVQDRLQDQYGPELDVFVPIDHKMAIACGAIIFRRNPEIIWSRKVEATYGDVVACPFDSDIHNPAYKLLDERGEYYCRSLFRPYAEVGDTICANEVLKNSIIPFECY